MRHPAQRVVGAGAAELLQRDVLASDRAYDIGAGDEHLRRLVDHDHEVGEGRRIDVAAGRRPHDQRDLRDDPGCQHVAPEDLAVQPERDDALLNPGAAALVDADDRAAVLHREVEHLDDLLAVHLAEAAAEDGDVLAEDADRASVHRAVAGHNAVAERAVGLHAERRRAVPGELVQLDERALVEQRRDAFTGRLLAPGVLAFDGSSRAGVHGLVVAVVEVGELAGSGVPIAYDCHGLGA